MHRIAESFAALQERPFRLLWLGQATSAVGDAMTPVALTFAVLGATGSAGDLGIVLAAYTLAHAVFILAGGVWADRLERRLVMLACDVVRAGAQTTLAVLVVAGEPTLWQFVLLAAVVGSAESFFGPALTGLIPHTVSLGRLQQANALIALTRSGSWIVGPALSGLIVATAGAGWVFALDAATFVVSAGFLAALRVPPAALAVRQTFLGDLVTGWREVRAHRWLWASLVCFGIGNLAWGAGAVLGPVVAEQELGGASAWGLIATGGGIGGLVGGLVALRWKPRRPLVVSHLITMAMGVLVAAYAIPLPTPGLVAASALAVLSIVVGNTIWETELQGRIRPEALSRVSSYDWAVSLVFMPLGYAVWGPLSEWIGLDTTLVLAGAIVIASKLSMLLVPEIRRLGRADAESEDRPSGVAAPL